MRGEDRIDEKTVGECKEWKKEEWEVRAREEGEGTKKENINRKEKNRRGEMMEV